MKKLILFTLCTLFMLPLRAVYYCAPSSWGFAGNSVTGGGSASPTLVKSESELKSALKGSNKVIVITQNITVSNQISTDKSNITLMALPGVKLISTGQSKEVSGILYLKGSNIILRNLVFEGPGPYDCDGKDNLTLDGATKIWVDHCDFQDGCDGNFDIKGKSDNITVTWCRFRYLKTPKAGGPGGADDHRFSNLVGSASTDKPEDGTYNITYGFCWWDEGCKQRMARCRNCLIHFLNCYWNSSVADYYVGPENASCYFEGCTFAGKANSAKNIYKGFNNTTNYCKFVNCSGNLPANKGDVAAPSYQYDQLKAAEAKNYVTNTCGAGATLTVTEKAATVSACDNGDTPPTPDPEDPEDPEPPTTEGTWWNMSFSEFNSLGTISQNTVIKDLHLAASSSETMTVDANNKTYGEHQFTHRLKLSGTGKTTGRYVWFGVKGDCTVDIYLMSASATENRQLNVAAGTFANVVSTLDAIGDMLKQTYTYKGDATKIFLYSAKSGINIYAIQLFGTVDPTATEDQEPEEGMENVPYSTADTQKVLHEGRILILRDGKTYDTLGRRIQ